MDDDGQYSITLEKAKRDLSKLRIERFQLENRISRLEQTVYSLSVLLNEPKIGPEMGLTEGIKALLRSIYPNNLYPLTVRLRLEQAGFTFTGKNPMASIHTVLKRLRDQELLKTVIDKPTGRIAFGWNADIRDQIAVSMSQFEAEKDRKSTLIDPEDEAVTKALDAVCGEEEEER